MFDAASTGEPGPVRRPEIEAMFARSAANLSLPAARFAVRTVEVPSAADELLCHPAAIREAQNFAPKRRAAFLAGRACARAALQQLTGIDSPVPRSHDRSPAWPAGITGSITHTDGFIAAVVAHRRGFVIGIDAERVERTERDVSRRILTDAEAEWVADCADPTLATMSVFSAKEAFYKAQFQVTKAWVGFHDVTTVEAGGMLELHPNTQLGALGSIVWPVRAAQTVLDGGTGERTVISALVAHPT